VDAPFRPNNGVSTKPGQLSRSRWRRSPSKWALDEAAKGGLADKWIDEPTYFSKWQHWFWNFADSPGLPAALSKELKLMRMTNTNR
jgi:hypothetical protein